MFNLYPGNPVPSNRKLTRATSVGSTETPLVFYGFDASEISPCCEWYECYIDKEVLEWFHSQQYCLNTTVRKATVDDIPRLLDVNTVNPLYFKEEDFKSSLKAKNEFILVAERMNSRGKNVIVGLIHYYLIWYCPHSHVVKRSVVSPPAIESAQRHQVVYVCTLEVVKESTHSSYIEKYGVQSEYATGKLLFCLACQHGIQERLRYLLLDSTDEALDYYTGVFGMQQNRKEKNHQYTPLQLNLDQFNYHIIYNPQLSNNHIMEFHFIVEDPHFSLICTLQSPSESETQTCSKLHLQFSSSGKQIPSTDTVIESNSGMSDISPNLSLLYSSSDPIELSRALSSLSNYSSYSKTQVEEVHIDSHILPLLNTSTDNPLMINGYSCEGKWHYDELSVEQIRLIDELQQCAQQNYSMINAVKDQVRELLFD